MNDNEKQPDQVEAEAAFEKELMPPDVIAHAVNSILSHWGPPAHKMYTDNFKLLTDLRMSEYSAAVVAMRKTLAEMMAGSSLELRHKKHHQHLHYLLQFEQLILRNPPKPAAENPPTLPPPTSPAPVLN